MDMDQANAMLEEAVQKLKEEIPSASFREKLGLVDMLIKAGVKFDDVGRTKTKKHEPLGLPDLRIVEKEAKAVS